MTPEQILELAHQAGMAFHMGQPHPAVMQQLELFAKLVEAATREECAKKVEQDLYPDDAGKPYTQQYNYSIKVLADKIRGMA